MSRDARGEKKRSEATAAAAAAAAAAAHGEAVATAAVGAKPQSQVVVRSSRGRSGGRPGDLGPSSRQSSAREGALSAAFSAGAANSPPVGARQGASLPLGTTWSPPAPVEGPSAVGNGNSSGTAKRTGRVQQHAPSTPSMGKPDDAVAQQDQVRIKALMI